MQYIAERTFDEEAPRKWYADRKAPEYDLLIGQSIFLNGANFKIAGILKSKGTSMAGSNDNCVFHFRKPVRRKDCI
ncbi:hypothetical protein [Caproiciproducens galactitolivorans]|uniref:Uncharacterized protein n=1 Tax=Caproiciproducens galactitolivorans TaxID=642589 RepID=A0ABT4BTY6_9FIRM|nr:hypothetical protein [Caproiciproducens galactitolivorans]MCY1714354.1 hypothetical protein [Caproiciproducens galactitolivorans]